MVSLVCGTYDFNTCFDKIQIERKLTVFYQRKDENNESCNCY